MSYFLGIGPQLDLITTSTMALTGGIALQSAGLAPSSTFEYSNEPSVIDNPPPGISAQRFADPPTTNVSRPSRAAILGALTLSPLLMGAGEQSPSCASAEFLFLGGVFVAVGAVAYKLRSQQKAPPPQMRILNRLPLTPDPNPPRMRILTPPPVKKVSPSPQQESVLHQLKEICVRIGSFGLIWSYSEQDRTLKLPDGRSLRIDETGYVLLTRFESRGVIKSVGHKEEPLGMEAHLEAPDGTIDLPDIHTLFSTVEQERLTIHSQTVTRALARVNSGRILGQGREPIIRHYAPFGAQFLREPTPHENRPYGLVGAIPSIRIVGQHIPGDCFFRGMINAIIFAVRRAGYWVDPRVMEELVVRAYDLHRRNRARRDPDEEQPFATEREVLDCYRELFQSRGIPLRIVKTSGVDFLTGRNGYTLHNPFRMVSATPHRRGDIFSTVAVFRGATVENSWSNHAMTLLDIDAEGRHVAIVDQVRGDLYFYSWEKFMERVISGGQSGGRVDIGHYHFIDPTTGRFVPIEKAVELLIAPTR